MPPNAPRLFCWDGALRGISRLPKRSDCSGARPLRDGARRHGLPHIAAVLVVQLRARIRHSRAVRRIVLPYGVPVHIGDVAGIEVVLMNKCVVDDDGTAAPAGMPAPPAPSMPTAAKEQPHINADTEAEPHSAEDDAARRPEPARIGIPERRSPDPRRIVDRNIEHRRVRRLDLNHRLAIVRCVYHVLLRRGCQFARFLGALPHALHRIHYVLLLRKERVAQIGGPGDVIIQPLQDVGEYHEGLNAGIPVLLLRGLRASGSVEAGVSLQPLISLDQFQRISAGHQDLAEQRVRVERDGRHQVIQLVGREGLVRRRKRGRLILREKKWAAWNKQCEEQENGGD